MKIETLLDTHTFLWWIVDNPKLSGTARQIIKNTDNEIYFSTVSAWEISIKARLKRIVLKIKPDILIPDQLQKNSFQVLSVQLSHSLKESSLPGIHNDPFDRILFAQSIVEDLPFLTADKTIKTYNLKTLW